MWAKVRIHYVKEDAAQSVRLQEGCTTTTTTRANWPLGNRSKMLQENKSEKK